VVTEFALEQHHERLLTLAAEAWDQAVAAREELAKVGTYFADRFGQPKAHPAVAVERDARIAFARLVRELDLDSDHSPDPDPATRLR
jgi:phage terminase small subunit